MFQLDTVLAADTWYIGDLPLCALLLSRDANYPWFILVPRQPAITEIHQLQDAHREQLMQESCQLSEILHRALDADKMNIAALGNVVPQLHVHHVVRYRDDAAWPAPIWGAAPAREYDENTLKCRLDRVLPTLVEVHFKLLEVPSL